MLNGRAIDDRQVVGAVEGLGELVGADLARRVRRLRIERMALVDRRVLGGPVDLARGHLDHPRHLRLERRGEHVQRALEVRHRDLARRDEGVRHGDRRGEVVDRVDPAHEPSDRVAVAQVAELDVDLLAHVARERDEVAFVASRGVATERDDLHAALAELLAEVAADEAAGARDERAGARPAPSSRRPGDVGVGARRVARGAGPSLGEQVGDALLRARSAAASRSAPAAGRGRRRHAAGSTPRSSAGSRTIATGTRAWPTSSSASSRSGVGTPEQTLTTPATSLPASARYASATSRTSRKSRTTSRRPVRSSPAPASSASRDLARPLSGGRVEALARPDVVEAPRPDDAHAAVQRRRRERPLEHAFRGPVGRQRIGRILLAQRLAARRRRIARPSPRRRAPPATRPPRARRSSEPGHPDVVGERAPRIAAARRGGEVDDRARRGRREARRRERGVAQVPVAFVHGRCRAARPRATTQLPTKPADPVTRTSTRAGYMP